MVTDINVLVQDRIINGRLNTNDMDLSTILILLWFVIGLIFNIAIERSIDGMTTVAGLILSILFSISGLISVIVYFTFVNDVTTDWLDNFFNRKLF